MKIAFDAKRMLNNATGLGNHARILVNALMRDYPENEYHFFTPKVQNKFLDDLKGTHQLHPPVDSFSKMLHPWWRSYGVTEELLSGMVDIYHGLSNELPLNIHRSGIKSVVTIHDLIFLKHEEQYPWIDRQIYEAKTKYASKHADKIIVVSEETKRDLMDIYKVAEEKITVIYPSVDPLFYRKKTVEEKQKVRDKYQLPAKFILNVGSFFPRKNQVRLVEAFDLIKDKIAEDLVLAGGQGNMQTEVQNLIQTKGLQGRVRIISDITNEDMPAVYQCASVFVFPSLLEGFGAPVLEALYSGVPVIASRNGAIKEAAGKSSILIDPKDVNDIADKIKQMLSDKDLQKKMIAEGGNHARTMIDTIFAKKTMDVYTTIAATPVV